MPTPSPRTARPAALPLVVALLMAPPPALAAYPSPHVAALAQLRAASSAPVTVSYQRGFPHHVTMAVPAPGGNPVARAQAFLTAYADLYYLSQPGTDLRLARVDDDGDGGTVVRFAQTYQGLPVFGAELTVHLGTSTAGAPQVTATAGMLLLPALVDRDPPARIAPDLVPALPAAEAEEIARQALGLPAAPVRGETALHLYAPAILRLDPLGPVPTGFPPDPILVYRVTLGSSEEPVQVLMDAHSGALLFRRGLSPTGAGLAGYDLRMWDYMGAGLSFDPSALLMGDEGGVSPAYLSSLDATAAWFAARATWLYFHDALGRHSYDNSNGLLDVNLNVSFPDGPNAKAHSNDISFSPGYVGRDIMAHEFAHHITRRTSGLIYAYEPGALNEAFSDIMGVSVDGDDWLIGEATTGNVFPPTEQCAAGLRNVENPTTHCCGSLSSCPDHVAQYLVTEQDEGGVHTNSNIINKAFYVMSEGGTFGQITVQGMGRAKMSRLAYGTFTLLPKNASFDQASWAFISKAAQWATSSTHGFTVVDRCGVHNALAVVGIRGPDLNCDGVEDGGADADLDWIFDDGDRSGTPGDNPCSTTQTSGCDDNCPLAANPDQADWDGDGDGDACDADDDNDGYPDGVDPCLGTANEFFDTDGDGFIDCQDLDDDNDGIPDDGNGDGNPFSKPCASGQVAGCDDNCKNDYNPTQFDGNANGLGDACDPDVDGDGFYVESDNCTFVFNPSQADTDGDGIGDACDLCPTVSDSINAYTPGIPELNIPPKPVQPDFDQDGLPDACDDRPYGSVSVTMGGINTSFFNPVRRDGATRPARFFGEPGAGGLGRLHVPGCDGGPPLPGQRYELILTGLPATVEVWLEDEHGLVLERARPSHMDPADRGFRFAPRCDEATYLYLRSGPGWAGDSAFTVRAELVAALAPSPWGTPDIQFDDEPGPLPDRDGDEILDGADTCPDTYDPTNQDRDRDGIGDVCDVCPATFNPDQGPVAFETIAATPAGAFAWPTPVAYHYAHGPFAGLSSYAASLSGPAPEGNSFSLAGDPLGWYLFRRTDCGTWGSAARDAALP